MRWSSGFLKSSWTTLWSMYWTARATRTRGTPICSNCMKAIVPVASCRSVWSTRTPIGSPGRSSPSTRCSARIRRVRFSAIGAPLPTRRRIDLYPRVRDRTPLPDRPGVALADRHLDERADRRGCAMLDDHAPRMRAQRQRERLVRGRGDHAGVRDAGLALVVLLDEEAPRQRAVGLAPRLELQPEHVGQPAAEAQVVVGGGHSRPVTSRAATTTSRPAKASSTARSGTTLTIATPATAPGTASAPSRPESSGRRLP